jgi:hypothetical protein
VTNPWPEQQEALAVPPEIVTAHDGQPGVGSWEPMFPLLTVDDSGFPHVCLLSRAELRADQRHIYAVLASPTTTANLRRRPVATLVVIQADTAHYLKLRVARASSSTPVAVAFEPASLLSDSLSVPLTPPRYLVASSLPVTEAWSASAELLARFATGTDIA